MSDNDDQNKPSAPKESIGKFVIRLTTPFELETEGLGKILCRRMTMKGSGVFSKRLKSLDGVENAKLIRIYLGCVSGLRIEDAEKLPEPLTEDEVNKLTDADIILFARAYLTNIAKQENISDPMKEMGDFIRRERAKELEDLKKMAKTINAALRVNATSDIMKHWSGLSENIKGSFSSIQEEIAKILGPAAAMQTSIADAMRNLQRDREKLMSHGLEGVGGSAMNDIREALTGNQASNQATLIEPPFLRFEPMKLPELPPVHETPMGRTALAVEGLSEAGQRMEDAMGFIVKQAGNVSDLIKQVFLTIEREAKSSQQQTQKALKIALLSLGLSVVALAVSAYYSRAGFSADREEAKTGDIASAKVIQRLEEQNALLRQFINTKGEDKIPALILQRLEEQNALTRDLLDESQKPRLQPAPKSTAKK